MTQTWHLYSPCAIARGPHGLRRCVSEWSSPPSRTDSEGEVRILCDSLAQNIMYQSPKLLNTCTTKRTTNDLKEVGRF